MINTSEIKIQLAVLGEFGCGKTSILDKYCRNIFFEEYIPTLGFETRIHRTVIGNPPFEIRLFIYDVSMTEEKECTEQILSNSDGIFLVFDLSNIESLELTKRQLEEVSAYASSKTQIYLIGNKSDKQSMSTMGIDSKMEIFNLMEKYNLSLHEINCLFDSESSLSKIFLTMITDYLKKLNYL